MIKQKITTTIKTTMMIELFVKKRRIKQKFRFKKTKNRANEMIFIGERQCSHSQYTEQTESKIMRITLLYKMHLSIAHGLI